MNGMEWNVTSLFVCCLFDEKHMQHVRACGFVGMRLKKDRLDATEKGPLRCD